MIQPFPTFVNPPASSRFTFGDGTTVPEYDGEFVEQSLLATDMGALDKIRDFAGDAPPGWSTVNPLRRLWRHNQRV